MKPGCHTRANPYNARSRAGIAQLVEHDLAKVGVASSSLVSRSIVRAFVREREDQKAAINGCNFKIGNQKPRLPGVLFFQAGVGKLADDSSDGQVAEWSCSGLQSRVRRFDSDPGLHSMLLRSSENARIKQRPSMAALFNEELARVAKSVDAADLKSADL
jgi:hypothetical protein